MSEITPTTGPDTFDYDAFIRELCRTLAMTTGRNSHLNLLSLLISGLMTWGPHNKAPLSYEQAQDAATDLVLEAVTGVMIAITEMTLTPDGNAPTQ